MKVVLSIWNKIAIPVWLPWIFYLGVGKKIIFNKELFQVQLSKPKSGGRDRDRDGDRRRDRSRDRDRRRSRSRSRDRRRYVLLIFNIHITFLMHLWQVFRSLVDFIIVCILHFWTYCFSNIYYRLSQNYSFLSLQPQPHFILSKSLEIYCLQLLYSLHVLEDHLWGLEGHRGSWQTGDGVRRLGELSGSIDHSNFWDTM